MPVMQHAHAVPPWPGNAHFLLMRFVFSVTEVLMDLSRWACLKRPFAKSHVRAVRRARSVLSRRSTEAGLFTLRVWHCVWPRRDAVNDGRACWSVTRVGACDGEDCEKELRLKAAPGQVCPWWDRGENSLWFYGASSFFKFRTRCVVIEMDVTSCEDMENVDRNEHCSQTFFFCVWPCCLEKTNLDNCELLGVVKL